MQQENILIWLPSPLGDAVLCTPALRAVRRRFSSAKITFLANDTVRQVLSANSFNDDWIVPDKKTIFALAGELRKRNFSTVVLFKNSFRSAVLVFLAGIKTRIGYTRENRGFLLTDRLCPAKLANGRYQPVSMIDYYLSIASWLGADTADRKLELAVQEQDILSLRKKLPQLLESEKPLAILVPGGAFGLSKCWPVDRFAKTADWLIENHNAQVVISVSPDKIERDIARQINAASKYDLINLAQNPLTLGELKALFSVASVVICNDTGPRHIAIAFDRKVVTMFGPNDPQWTQTGHGKEVQIIGRAPCVPCLKPRCTKKEHLCMNSIPVERVCTAADKMLKDEDISALSDKTSQFVPMGESFFVEQSYEQDFRDFGLTSIKSVFALNTGQNLAKKNLAGYRTRIKFQIGSPAKDVYLKRYENPPLSVQLDKWLCNHGPVTCGLFEANASRLLNASGINTSQVMAFGEKKLRLFENKSFVITLQVPRAASLEQKLPGYFDTKSARQSSLRRRIFIKKLANFIKRFHNTRFRHRDLYLCHIFCDDNEQFTLIDLARAFVPIVFKRKFLVKDIAQLYYSAPGGIISRTDRLRFYRHYRGRKKITVKDKKFIKEVLRKVESMARHDKKHGRTAPFRNTGAELL